jgi:hypothetical protein
MHWATAELMDEVNHSRNLVFEAEALRKIFVRNGEHQRKGRNAAREPVDCFFVRTTRHAAGVTTRANHIGRFVLGAVPIRRFVVYAVGATMPAHFAPRRHNIYHSIIFAKIAEASRHTSPVECAAGFGGALAKGAMHIHGSRRSMGETEAGMFHIFLVIR